MRIISNFSAFPLVPVLILCISYMANLGYAESGSDSHIATVTGMFQDQFGQISEDLLLELLNDETGENYNLTLHVIAEQKISSMRKDVLDFLKRMESSNTEYRELFAASAIGCLFVLDGDFNEGEFSGYLSYVRNMLHSPHKKISTRIEAFRALLAAQKYRNIDIKKDLELLIEKEKETIGERASLSLIKLYSDRISDDDVEKLIRLWKDKPLLQNQLRFYRRKALFESSDLSTLDNRDGKSGDTH